jgi:hypothetical protein
MTIQARKRQALVQAMLGLALLLSATAAQSNACSKALTMLRGSMPQLPDWKNAVNWSGFDWRGPILANRPAAH